MDDAIHAADFYTGLVAEMYRHLRSEMFDPEVYAQFVGRFGEPALELGCGDGDPLLELRARGLDVEGLDSSADMLERCRIAATARGIEVTLHRSTFESMDLGRRYRSIYFAGATFNLLTDDAAALAALHRIAAHLEPGGAALVPLFVPDPVAASDIGTGRQHVTPDGVVMRCTVLDTHRDDAARTQTSVLRYVLDDGAASRVTDRPWTLHWLDQVQFASMAEHAGLTVHGVYRADGTRATPDDTTFTFVLQPARSDPPGVSG